MTSPHRGVKLLRLGDGRHVARFVDPIARKQVQQSLDALGLTNVARRRLWAIEKSKALLALRAQVAHGGASQTRVTVEQAQAEYLAGHANENSKKNNRPPLADVAAFLAGRGIAAVQDITQPAVAAWGNHVRRPANPHRPSTRNLSLVIAGAWLRWCRRGGLLPRVNGEEIKDALRRVKVPRDPISILRPTQIRELLRACIAHDAAEREPVGPFVLTVLCTGMRYSEAAGLSWSEVDVEERALRLGASRTKTKQHRVIPLAESPAVLEVLQALRLQSGARDGRVFPLYRKSTTAQKRLVRDYDAPAGWTWVQLRRTCGSLLVCSNVYGGGAAPFLTAKRLGHGIAVSERHYLGAITGLPKNATTIEQAGGFEVEAQTIVRAVAVTSAKAVAHG